MELTKLRLDLEKVESGTWVEIEDDAMLLIARSGNKAAIAAYDRLLAPYKQLMERGKMPQAKLKEINIKIVAESILLDWSGLKVDGVELPYSKETAYKLLSDPEYAPFLRLVQDLASEEELFRAEQVEAAAKK